MESSRSLFIGLKHILPLKYRLILNVFKMFYVISGYIPEIDNLHTKKLRKQGNF